MTRYNLVGLRADNLVAFMAAAGVLRTAKQIWPLLSPKLSWRHENDSWRAILHIDGGVARSEFLAGLQKHLTAQSGTSALNLADDLTISFHDFHVTLADACNKATQDERVDVDFLASFGSDAVQSRNNGKLSGRIVDTAFRTMSGAGHQHFLGTIRTLVEDTDIEHLEAALFRQWQYADPLKSHSLRWDPTDDVRYALQWNEPSGDPARSASGCVWGANRLAVEALPLFATMPTSGKLTTTGFAETRGNTKFTWPVWDMPIDLDTLYSIVALKELQAESPDRAKLAKRGVRDVFSCRRITQGKFRNFTSARPV
jgi:hypothetical protein